MNDSEIIKALECCISTEKGSCQKKKCPMINECRTDIKSAEKYALDLITRQKAEIERLQEKYSRTMDGLKAVLAERADHSEAIKEFVSELIKKAGYESYGHGRTVVRRYLIDVDCFENIVKEKVGDV